MRARNLSLFNSVGGVSKETLGNLVQGWWGFYFSVWVVDDREMAAESVAFLKTSVPKHRVSTGPELVCMFTIITQIAFSCITHR
jgi:hypothetical protein